MTDQTSSKGTDPSKRLKNWLVLGLAASLALNIFILGFLLAKSESRYRFPPKSPPSFEGRGGGGFTLRAIGQYLDPDERQQVRKAARKQMRAMRSLADDRRNSHQIIRDLLMQDDLDMAALTAELDRLQQTTNKLRAGPQAVILDVLTRLSPDDRKAFAENLYLRGRKRAKKPLEDGQR